MDNPVSRLSSNFFAGINAQITKLRAEGADVIRLDIGSPDLPPPSHILQALSESAANSDHHGYQSHRGTKEYRQAWAVLYHRLYEMTINPDGVLPLLGSKEGVFHLSQAILNPGDVVLVPDPGYQTYIQGAVFAGAKPVALPLLPENDYLPDFSAISPEIAQRAKLLWLNYPNNPTGAVASLDFFSKAVEFCQRYQILLCHDAAYTQVAFNGFQPPSVLQVPGAFDTAIEFNTLSKSHNMAGWRLGAAIGNSSAVNALLKLKTHADSGHFRPVLDAAVAALRGDQSWIEERNAVYQERKDIVLTFLQKMGLTPREPQASLYIWSPIPSGWTSSRFTNFLLERTHVSLAPGTIFGSRGKGYVRISLVQPKNKIREAMRRIYQMTL